MKLTIPEDLQHHFRMIMKSVPLGLQEKEGFKDTTLVYLKLGGLQLARYYVKMTKKNMDKDPLGIGVKLRFPKMVEAKLELVTNQQDEEKEDDDDQSQVEPEKNGT